MRYPSDHERTTLRAGFREVTSRSKPSVFHNHRLMALMVLAVVVLVSPRAHAVAPLCVPSAASMPAPVPAPPNATGDLVAPKNCDESGFSYLDASRPGRDAPPPDWRSSP